MSQKTYIQTYSSIFSLAIPHGIRICDMDTPNLHTVDSRRLVKSRPTHNLSLSF